MNIESMDKILEELDKTRQFLLRFRETGKMPDIERDIVLAKFRMMYESLQLIQIEKVDNTEIPHIEPKPHTEVMEQELHPVPEEPVSKTIEFGHTSENEAITIEKKPEAIKEESIEIKNIIQEVHQESHQKSQKNVKAEILAEKFQNQGFLNEALAKYQNATDLSKKMQNQPIKDIFSAINLNDKFLFIKELFNNDAALYQSTIEKLNSAGNFNDAVRYLDSNFSWDFSKPMVQDFLELVRRRFL
ncbi:MAG TPA: hypothetical protein VIH57_15440 [Bacteroidales bacterium]